MNTKKSLFEAASQPSFLGAVSGSFHYTLDDVKNIKANAEFIKNKQAPIEAFGIPEFMEMVIKLADDCLAARNVR